MKRDQELAVLIMAGAEVTVYGRPVPLIEEQPIDAESPMEPSHAR